MSLPNSQETFDPFFVDEQDTDQTLKKYIDQFITYWYFFVISIVICVILAVLYARFSPLGYQINAKILVKDDKTGSPGNKGLVADMDLSALLGASSNAQNEIEVLKSRSLMTKVVHGLQLQVTNSLKVKLRTIEAQDRQIPYEVELSKEVDSIESKTYIIDQITTDHFHIVNSEEGIDQQGIWGKAIQLPQFSFTLHAKPNFKRAEGNIYYLNIQAIDSKVEALMQALEVNLTDKQSTVIDLSLKYPVPSKGEKILQNLMEVYLQDNLEDKIRIADSTLNFINSQLAGVSSDLKNIEGQIQEFKENNNLADMQSQSEALVGDASEYFKKLNDVEIKLNVLESISKYINSPKNKRIIPTSLNIEDPVFGQYITAYNELIMQRDRGLLSYTTENPNIVSLDEQIESTRQNVLRSFKVYLNNLKQIKAELSKNNSQFNNEIKKAPKKERYFLEYSRQQSLRQQLYIFLLEKKEETAISRNSTFSTSQILDAAKSVHKPYAPKNNIIYLVGLLAGIGLPLSFLSIKEMLNIRIQSKKDITQKTQLPIAGEIGHNPEGQQLVVNSRSVISEQFRGLRTNLQFMLPGNQANVIMITSSMSGEGKTFMSSNLSYTLAISGKTVVLMELDLRKPKLSSTMGLDHTNGYSNYAVNDQVSVADIIKPSGLHPNISIISSGPTPPNPSELLLNMKLDSLIAELKLQFDYVVIDTAPVGIVSDALLVEKYADLSLYILRQKLTYKNQLHLVTDLVAQHKLRKVALVINDIGTHWNNYYGYNEGYNYAYGAYAEGAIQQKWWRRKR